MYSEAAVAGAGKVESKRWWFAPGSNRFLCMSWYSWPVSKSCENPADTENEILPWVWIGGLGELNAGWKTICILASSRSSINHWIQSTHQHRKSRVGPQHRQPNVNSSTNLTWLTHIILINIIMYKACVVYHQLGQRKNTSIIHPTTYACVAKGLWFQSEPAREAL